MSLGLKIVRELYSETVAALRRRDYDYAYRYSSLVREVLVENRIRRPRWITFCKNCGIILIPGLSASIRLRRRGSMKYIVTRCVLCGYINRRPYRVGRARDTR